MEETTREVTFTFTGRFTTPVTVDWDDTGEVDNAIFDAWCDLGPEPSRNGAPGGSDIVYDWSDKT